MMQLMSNPNSRIVYMSFKNVNTVDKRARFQKD